MTQRYLTVREAALYIGVSEAGMRQRIHRGTIPFIRDGRNIRLDVHELDRYMAQRKVARRREAADHEGTAST